MIARALGISPQAWERWLSRQDRRSAAARVGRPFAIDPAARERIRGCYVDRFGAWGPRVLAQWCAREGLGRWSASTIAKVIADLVPAPAPPRPSHRYEVTRSGAMWSEDGAGFEERKRKKELLLLQDEHARYKTGHRLVGGAAKEQDVIDYLETAFERYGAPLVLKHDGGSIFHTGSMRELLDRWQVVDLTGPRYWPGYNGKAERSIRDVRGMEHQMREHGVGGHLADRLEVVIEDLNELRPRPVLGGCTAREVYDRDGGGLPNRATFRRDVDLETRRLQARACSRRQRQASRRHAIENVLSRYGLLQEVGNVSHH